MTSAPTVPDTKKPARTVPDTETPDSETPPVPWRRLYALLVVELSVVVAACYALTRWAA